MYLLRYHIFPLGSCSKKIGLCEQYQNEKYFLNNNLDWVLSLNNTLPANADLDQTRIKEKQNSAKCPKPILIPICF